jgi:very-short-patch-repair endonuclease
MRKMPAYQKELARGLRHDQTATEGVLWEQLRGRAIAGAKFRRQRPLGRYIADFCRDAARLVVEIDGAAHDPLDRQEYDKIRDDALAAHGYAVLRFSVNEIRADLPSVLSRITAALQ